MKTWIRALLVAVCLAVFAFSGWRLWQYQQQDRQSRQSYAALADAAVASPPAQTPAPSAEGPMETPAATQPGPVVDFEALAVINPDIVGWLYCEGTPLNYPIVQGEDNDYYLDHLFDGTVHASGCPFLDYRVPDDFTGAHSIVYGHHMKDGSLFASLCNYEEQDYYNEHPRLLLITPERVFAVELFAGYATSVEANAWTLTFDGEDARNAWIEEALAVSAFVSDVRPAASESILTLSTCSYVFDDARFVVHGVLREIQPE